MLLEAEIMPVCSNCTRCTSGYFVGNIEVVPDGEWLRLLSCFGKSWPPQAALRGGCLLSAMAHVGREARLSTRWGLGYFLWEPVSPSLCANTQTRLPSLRSIQSGWVAWPVGMALRMHVRRRAWLWNCGLTPYFSSLGKTLDLVVCIKIFMDDLSIVIKLTYCSN